MKNINYEYMTCTNDTDKDVDQAISAIEGLEDCNECEIWSKIAKYLHTHLGYDSLKSAQAAIEDFTFEVV